MRAAAKTVILLVLFSFLSSGQAGATAIATDITSVIDLSSLSFTVDGADVGLVTYNSLVYTKVETSIQPALSDQNSGGYNNDADRTAAAATTNAAAESSITTGDSLTTRISTLSDFTTTQTAAANALAKRIFFLNTGSYSELEEPELIEFTVSVDYSFAGSASTELPGDYLGLQTSGAYLALYLQVPNADGFGSHSVPLNNAQDYLYGTDDWIAYPEPGGSFTKSGTLSFSSSYTFGGELNPWGLFVELESRAYAQTGASQAGSSSSAVPEPSTMLLLGSGLLGLAGLNRRRQT